MRHVIFAVMCVAVMPRVAAGASLPCTIEVATNQVVGDDILLRGNAARAEMPMLDELKAIAGKAPDPHRAIGDQLAPRDAARFAEVSQQLRQMQLSAYVESAHARDAGVVEGAAATARCNPGNGLFIPLRHSPPMRPSVVLPFILMPWLAGCANWTEPTGAFFAANAASVVVFQRSLPDILFSFITGKDCSIVRLDQGKTYCAVPEEARYQPFCTRSLGVVDCWADPEHLPAPYRNVADAPAPLPVQEQWRRAPWPKQVNVGL